MSENPVEQIIGGYHVGWRKGVDSETGSLIWSALERTAFHNDTIIRGIFQSHVTHVGECFEGVSIKDLQPGEFGSMLKEAALSWEMEPLPAGTLQENLHLFAAEEFEGMLPVKWTEWSNEFRLTKDERGGFWVEVHRDKPTDLTDPEGWERSEHISKNTRLLNVIYQILAANTCYADRVEAEARAEIRRGCYAIEIAEATLKAEDSDWKSLAGWFQWASSNYLRR